MQCPGPPGVNLASWWHFDLLVAGARSPGAPVANCAPKCQICTKCQMVHCGRTLHQHRAALMWITARTWFWCKFWYKLVQTARL